jgi:two-component system OmpR family response regulator
MQRAPHVLVVDDDPKIRNGVAGYLRDHGLRATTAADGKAMMRSLEAGRFDVILLDVMLPDGDGLSLLRRMGEDKGVPVIMLTALGGEADRIVGLESGADDYVCKPFSLRELLARIKVVMRRRQRVAAGSSSPSTQFAFAGWTLDIRARTLLSPSLGHVELTTGEFDLLQAFVEHPHRILNRDQLLDLARGRATLSVDRSIDVMVMRLRRKIEADPQAPAIIKTVRNGGYVFTADVTPAVAADPR